VTNHIAPDLAPGITRASVPGERASDAAAAAARPGWGSFLWPAARRRRQLAEPGARTRPHTRWPRQRLADVTGQSAREAIIFLFALPADKVEI
jgi:hypothetical protein